MNVDVYRHFCTLCNILRLHIDPFSANTTFTSCPQLEAKQTENWGHPIQIDIKSSNVILVVLVQAPVLNFNTHLLPLSKKKMTTAVVKCNNMAKPS